MKESANFPARNVKALQLTADDIESAMDSLPLVGIQIDAGQVEEMFAMDAIQATITPASIATPVQYLQSFMPGLVRIVTGPRTIDLITGLTVKGDWEDEEVIQGVLELTGLSVPYGDFTNIPFSSWNLGHERRTIVRFEEGLIVGRLEEARAAKIGVDSAATKREAAALALDIQRNRVGFYGYNNGAGRTYGLLNDPALPAYSNLPNGDWATATYLEIVADIRSWMAGLRTQSNALIDPNTTPLTMVLASDAVDYLGVTSEFGNSVMDWLTKTYPNVRILSTPEFNDANGGANVGYLYADRVDDNSTDGGQVFQQIVPVKLRLLGVEQNAKNYIEDYTNATAGVMLTRPWAVARRSGF
jgi:hypothetical protein